MLFEEIYGGLEKDYDDFLLREFEKRGYTLEKLKSDRHKLECYITDLSDGSEIREYFADENCILKVFVKAELGVKSENF